MPGGGGGHSEVSGRWWLGASAALVIEAVLRIIAVSTFRSKRKLDVFSF